MIRGDYKKVLLQIFDVLGLTEPEREEAAEKFKKLFAADLLVPLQDRLSREDQEWIIENMNNIDIDRDRALEIQRAIKNAFSEEEIDRLSRDTFKVILVRYTSFMINKLDQEKSSQIRRIVDSF